MAWADVTWANGQVVTEIKMNNMVGNTTHVRDEFDVRTLLVVPGDKRSPATVITPERVRMRVFVDSSEVMLSADTSTSWLSIAVANYPVSTVTAGLRSLHVDIEFRADIVNWPSNAVVRYTARWRKTPDINYLSIFGELALATGSGERDYLLRGLTIFGHRQSGALV